MDQLYGKKVIVQIAFGGRIGGSGAFSIQGVVTSIKTLGEHNIFICIDEKKYINTRYIVAIEEI